MRGDCIRSSKDAPAASVGNVKLETLYQSPVDFLEGLFRYCCCQVKSSGASAGPDGTGYRSSAAAAAAPTTSAARRRNYYVKIDLVQVDERLELIILYRRVIGNGCRRRNVDVT